MEPLGKIAGKKILIVRKLMRASLLDLNAKLNSKLCRK